MARIAGIDLPGRKHTVIALQYIYGIGPHHAKQICEIAGTTELFTAPQHDYSKHLIELMPSMELIRAA